MRLLFLTGATLGEPNILVEFDGLSSDAHRWKPNLSLLLDLTAAERVVALEAAALKTNDEIVAMSVGRSVGTVKAQLHAVYKKLNVRTPSELVALLRT